MPWYSGRYALQSQANPTAAKWLVLFWHQCQESKARSEYLAPTWTLISASFISGFPWASVFCFFFFFTIGDTLCKDKRVSSTSVQH